MKIKVACHDCGNEIEVSESWYNAVKRSNKQFRCKACIKLWRQQVMKNRMDSMSDEDRQKMYNKIVEKNKINYSKMSKEDIAKRMMNLQKASAEWRKNVTPEEKERISKIHTETNNRVWEEYRSNPEKYAEYLKKLNERWNNKTDEEKKQFSNATKDRWKNYSDEELNAVKNRMKNGAIQRWENMDDNTKMELSYKISDSMKSNWENDEYRDKQLNAIRDGFYTWWDSLSDKEERYKPIVNNMLSGRKEWWNNLPNSEKSTTINKLHERRNEWWKKSPITSKEAFIKKVLTSSAGKNKLHQYFESRFNKLDYDLIPEYPTSNHGVTHCWDYAIFHEYNELWMLVDLDGAYFHADICDYDGMHSKLEYDEKRGLSIPSNVKWCIIYEKDFDKSFAYMQSILPLTYNEFIDKRVKEYRSMSFPYPEYTYNELLKSYRDLCKLNCDDKYHKSLNVNTRLGDRIIQHFHHSMYDGLLSTWNNDETLRDMITNGYLYHSYINKNKILQGFNIYEPCKRMHYISAGKSKMIINRYLNEYDELFCPKHSSSIMLACIAMNKRYVGLFENETHLIEASNLLGFLCDNKIEYNVTLNKFNACHQSTYQCLFTGVLNDDQINEYLTKYRCKRYVFNIDDTVKYVDNVVDISNDEFIIIIENGD